MRIFHTVSKQIHSSWIFHYSKSQLEFAVLLLGWESLFHFSACLLSSIWKIVVGSSNVSTRHLIKKWPYSNNKTNHILQPPYYLGQGAWHHHWLILRYLPKMCWSFSKFYLFCQHKMTLCLKKNQEIVYFEPNMSDQGMGIRIQVIMNVMLWSGGTYINFYSQTVK